MDQGSFVVSGWFGEEVVLIDLVRRAVWGCKLLAADIMGKGEDILGKGPECLLL